MVASGTPDRALLATQEYLLDPPQSVWRGLLNADHATWLDIRDLEIVRLTQERAREYGEAITREAWLGLYSPASPLKSDPPSGMLVSHSIFARAGELEEWSALRASVGADEVAAAFGAAHFVRELIDRLPEEVQEKMKEAERAQQALQGLRGQIEALKSMAYDKAGPPHARGERAKNASIDALKEKIQQLKHEADDAKAESERRAGELTKALSEGSARTKQALSGSIMQAASNLSGLRDVARELGFGWGQGASAGVTREEIEGLQELAEHLKRSPHLKKLLDLLGWAKRTVAAERRKSRHGREVFTHHQTQDLDLETLAPEELMGLVDPDPGSVLSLDFLRRALDGELLHRRYEGEEQAGRGPFVILTDKSGSMRGWQNATACALELALMRAAIEAGRRFVSIPFSGKGQYEVFDPGHRPDPKELLQHIETFYGGGTEPFAPLEAAFRLIEEGASLKEGDALIITDGAFGAPPEGFLERLASAREAPGLKIVAVVIDEAPGQAGFADRVILVEDLFHERDRLAAAIAPLL